jgi:hypoxanthine phosphoribosyltransferase
MDAEGRYGHLVHAGMRPGRILIDREAIAVRVRQLADEIAIDCHSDVAEDLGASEEAEQAPRPTPEITIVAVMTGALLVTADLVRTLPVMMKIHLLDISSYPGTAVKAGALSFRTELPGDQIAGRRVLVIDDVLDTGRTLGTLVERLEAAGAASVRTCVLVSKPRAIRRNAAAETQASESPPLMEADYVGFEIPDEFVVGYGMDFDDKYRNLPDICVLSRVD